ATRSPEQRALARDVRALRGVAPRPGRRRGADLQPGAARARGGGGRPRRVPAHRPLRRGGLRELGERIPPDGGLRPADRLPLPEGVVGVEGPRRGAAAGPGRARAGQPARRPLAGAAGGRGALGLRAVTDPDAVRAVRRLLRPPRGRWCPTVRGGATEPRAAGAVDAGFPEDLRVLVPVVPELAERVSLRWRPGRPLGRSPPARLPRVEAGRRGARRDRGGV
ncbi:MAG: hypothetical protein AVDCRST_MAG49-2074, partial [uncultured Thermomicrobiales bacterium]